MAKKQIKRKIYSSKDYSDYFYWSGPEDDEDLNDWLKDELQDEPDEGVEIEIFEYVETKTLTQKISLV